MAKPTTSNCVMDDYVANAFARILDTKDKKYKRKIKRSENELVAATITIDNLRM